MIRAVRERLNLTMPHDNKNSGQTLSQLIAERANPVADIAYFGATFGIRAAAEGVLQPYRPPGFDELPAGLRDAQARWHTIHVGTLGLFVNVDALGNRPIPRCWADLAKPEYRGMVGYLNPSSAAVGYVGAVAVNLALGGSMENWTPAIDLFRRLAANQAIVPQQTSYARVVSGEIPILFDFDFNAYRAKYTERGRFEFVIPCEGTVSFPYVIGLVANARNAANARRVLDFILSDEGQRIWTNAYLRPARNIPLPAEVASRFLPAADYARARDVDWGAWETVQAAFTQRYLAEVR
jgi:putative spermidine/putrescine transport system substrate-binding protein